MKKLFAFIVLSCAISLTACNNTDNEFDSPILSKVEEMLNNRTSSPIWPHFSKRRKPEFGSTTIFVSIIRTVKLMTEVGMGDALLIT